MTRTTSSGRLAAAFLIALALVVMAPAGAASAFGAETGLFVPARRDTIRQMQWHLRELDVASVHRITRGAGVVVAVIDSGVEASHPDLSGQVLKGIGIGGAAGPEGGSIDPDGHGTAVAGIIAAKGGADNRALGIAPAAKILPVRLSKSGAVGGFSSRDVADAIRWAADNGADIINLSIADDREVLSYEREAIAYAQSKDVVVVAGAGNRNEGHTVIGAYGAVPGVLCVAATGPSGKLWPYSVTGDRVALAAPGQDIVSTGSRRAGSKTGYVSGSGTSFATAVVSGAAALVRSKFPDLSAADVINRLIATATDAGAPGRDDEYGFGRLDLRRALTADVAHVETNPLGDAAAAPAASEQGDDDASRPDDRWGWGFYLLAALALCLLLWVVVVTVMVIVIRRRRSPPPPPPYPPGAGPYFGPHPTGVPPSPAGAPSIAPYPQAPPGGPPPTGQPPFRST